MSSINRVYYYCPVELARDDLRMKISIMWTDQYEIINLIEVARSESTVLYVTSSPPIDYYAYEIGVEILPVAKKYVFVRFDASYDFLSDPDEEDNPVISELCPSLSGSIVPHPSAYSNCNGNESEGVEIHYTVPDEEV